MTTYLDARLPDIFWSKTKADSVTGCWFWTAALFKDNPRRPDTGYGAYWDKPNRKVRRAHKFAYEVLVGSVPVGLVLDHEVCSEPSCVNPDHLVPKTINQNGHRERGNLCYSRKHELAGDNLIIKHCKRWGKQRVCRTCRNEKRNAQRALHGRAAYDNAKPAAA